MPDRSPGKPSSARTGCLPILLIGVATCSLIVLNGLLLTYVLPQRVVPSATWLSRPKLMQSVSFVLPVILTLLQWWLFDFFYDVWRTRSGRRTD